MGTLSDLHRTELEDRDSRIFPGPYAPVMVMENGGRVVKPMRYQCRPAGKPAFYDCSTRSHRIWRRGGSSQLVLDCPASVPVMSCFLGAGNHMSSKAAATPTGAVWRLQTWRQVAAGSIDWQARRYLFGRGCLWPSDLTPSMRLHDARAIRVTRNATEPSSQATRVAVSSCYTDARENGRSQHVAR